MRNITAIRGRPTVLIIADQPVVRYGFARLLAREPDIDVVGEDVGSAEILHTFETLRPDLATVSLPLDSMGHHEAIGKIKLKYPTVKVLAAIRHDDSHLAGSVLHAGADGCIHWGESLKQIVEAIRTVLRGEIYVGSHVAKKLLRRAMENRSLDGNPMESLSNRELDVFTMIGQGQTTQQIARQLDLSTRTIETHRKNIKMKLGLQNAMQLSRCAFQWIKCETD
jgi:DNA-binding NarL/FixJ family response regulator